MTTDIQTAARPLFPKSSSETRRLLALPGVIAVVGAMLTAAVSFVVLLGGVEPYVAPNERTTLAVIAVNAIFVLLLIALIGREAHRILRRDGARQGGLPPACPHRYHVLAGGRHSRHPGGGRGLDHARHRPRPLVRDPHQDDHQLIAVDRRSICPGKRPQSAEHDIVDGLYAGPARSLYNLDRTGFRELITRQAIGRGLAHAALVRSDGSVIVAAKHQCRFRHAGNTGCVDPVGD